MGQQLCLYTIKTVEVQYIAILKLIKSLEISGEAMVVNVTDFETNYLLIQCS